MEIGKRVVLAPPQTASLDLKKPVVVTDRCEKHNLDKVGVDRVTGRLVCNRCVYESGQ